MLMHDLRFAVRSLWRNPSYTLAGALTLVLGIGANVAVFSVVYGILLAPLPFPDSDSLVMVWEENGSGSPMGAAWVNFTDWRDRQRSFESITAFGAGGTATVLGLGQPQRIGVTTVSDGFFTTLGVQPAQGRAFLPEEHQLGGPPAAIISDGIWRTQLGADPSWAEREIDVGGFRARIVGIMPPGFDYPGDIDIWGPLELTQQSDSRTAHNWRVVGRLSSETDIARADAELDAITAVFLAEEPGVVEEDWFEDFFPRGARVEPLLEAMVGDTKRPLWILLGASVLVLLVACTNLASATLARGTGREREYAVRRSLGASRGTLIRHIFTESLVLAVTGGVLGIGFAAAALRLLPALVPAGIPRIDDVALNPTIMAVALITTVATAILFGLFPALRASEGSFASTMRTGGRGGHGVGRHRIWNALIAVEVALALTLLVGSGLLLRSFWTVLQVQPGFRTDGVLLATVSPPASKYGDDDSKRAFYDALLRELETVPGGASVGLIAGPPMTGVSNGLVGTRGGAQAGVTGDYQLASAGYFEAMGIPLLRGRVFDETDLPDGPHVVVVNSAFAEAAWPGEDPIGKQMTGGGMDNFWDKDRWATVIGIVGDVRQRDLTLAARPTYYFDYRQRPFRSWSMTAMIRPGRGSAEALGGAVREAIRRVDPDVPLTLSTIEDRISTALTPRRFTMIILGFFAAAALTLACVGIWGVVAYAVARRTREIGIRMALGADASSVRRLVQRGYLHAAGAGALAGLALSLAIGRVLSSLLFEVRPTDPITLAAVLAALASATWLASFFPSRRSTRVSPMETMRTD